MKQIGVIMAGGVGERFWPFTSEAFPKYAMPFRGKLSFLEETYNRLLPVYGREGIYLVTNEDHRPLVRRLLKRMPAKHFLFEPRRRNTAGAVALTHFSLRHKLGLEDTLSFFPADQVIRDRTRFHRILSGASRAAREYSSLVTLGIVPDYPATGYGYIEARKRLGAGSGVRFLAAKRFVEKPDLKKARSFIQNGHFYWNAGIFTWTVRDFESQMKKHAPEYWSAFENALAPQVSVSRVRALFNRIASVSIDKLLAEKADRMTLIPSDIGWADIGTWQSLCEFRADEKGNCLDHAGYFDEVSQTFLRVNPGTRVALIGLRNIAVVQKDHELLVCSLDKAQDVSKAYRALRASS